MVYVTCRFHKIFFVLCMSCLVQDTIVFPGWTGFNLEVDADTVVFYVATQFTGILVYHFDGFYTVINQTFSIEETGGWELQLTALI